MRWIASLVAEAYRILARGGVFLYPGDMRQGYSAGRLRLIYEANPISLIIENAGGTATDCARRIPRHPADRRSCAPHPSFSARTKSCI